MTAPNSLDVIENLIQKVIEPAALDVDREGAFPRASIDALLEAGFGGLITAQEHGGMGAGFDEASAVAMM